MFIHRNEEMLFFIEEPELNLHPGLQRKLIEAMLSDEFSNHQFFLTTHSNHLLDLTLDYSFVEYSGANLIHWNFDDADNLEEINAKYLSRHIFLVADNDFPNNNSKKKKNQEILEGILKDNYYKLPVREIENLLSVSVLKKVIIDREKKEDIVFKPEITKESVYAQEHIGCFINDRAQNRKYNYIKADTNMLYNKTDFCNRSLKFLNKYDNMSEEAKKLAKKIYEFITSHK